MPNKSTAITPTPVAPARQNLYTVRQLRRAVRLCDDVLITCPTLRGDLKVSKSDVLAALKGREPDEDLAHAAGMVIADDSCTVRL
ncbi:unnamed protein product [marine sediment metagenome]|uniref:Uncharacterized protein n=1 Tax=marine sediment metagenome TaxID=412755 RepID=X0WYS4_9ZZZZ